MMTGGETKDYTMLVEENKRLLVENDDLKQEVGMLKWEIMYLKRVIRSNELHISKWGRSAFE